MKKVKILSFAIFPLMLGLLASCGNPAPDATVAVNNGQALAMAKIEETGVKEAYKLDGTNLKKDDLLTFVYKGNNINSSITAYSAEDNNIDIANSAIKVHNNKDNASMTLRVLENNQYTLYVSGRETTPPPTPVTKYLVSKDDGIENGDISLETGEFDAGKQINVTATPDSGYQLVGITINGVQKSTTSPYSFKVEDEADDQHKIVVGATFEEVKPEVKYLVSKDDGIENGDISLETGEFDAGKQIDVTATPDSGYELVAITINGEEKSTTSPYSFKVEDEADDQHQIVVGATFEESIVPITGLSISGPDTVVENSSVTLTASPVPEGAIFPLDVEWSVISGDEFVLLPDVKVGTTISVTGLLEGTATIKATCGELYDTFVLEVLAEKPESNVHLMGVEGDWTTGIPMQLNKPSETEYIVENVTVDAGDAIKVKVGTDDSGYIGDWKKVGENSAFAAKVCDTDNDGNAKFVVKAVVTVYYESQEGDQYGVFVKLEKVISPYKGEAFAGPESMGKLSFDFNLIDDNKIEYMLLDAPAANGISYEIQKDGVGVNVTLEEGGEKENFTVVGTKFTYNGNAESLNFYLKESRVDSSLTCYVENPDKPILEGFYIEVDGIPTFKLVDNPSGQNEMMFLDADLEADEIIKVYDADSNVSFIAKLDGSKIENAFQFIDGTGIKVLIGGNYDIYLKLSEGNDSIYFDAYVPLPTDLTASVSGDQIPWAFNDQSKLFVGAFNDQDQVTWINVPSSNTDSLSFTVPEGTVKFLIVRTNLQTEEPNWSETQDVPGRIYNKTEDKIVIAGTTTYSVTFVNYPN